MSDTLQPLAPDVRQKIQARASEGLRYMGQATDWQVGRTTGDNYLGSIAKEVPQSPEGQVAGIVERVTDQPLIPQSAYRVNEAALRAIASGIPGPLGPAISDVALQGTGHAQSFPDARHEGIRLLNEIAAASADPLEKVLAEAASAGACARQLDESAYNVAVEAFQEIKAGGLSGSPETVLAHYGRTARMKTKNMEDSRYFGHAVLDDIVKESKDPTAAILAKIATDATGISLTHQTGGLAQDVAFQYLETPSKLPLEQQVSRWGIDALDNASNGTDQRAIGSEILRGLMRQATDPAVKTLAVTAINTAAQYLYDRSAAGAHYEAFKVIRDNSQSEPADKLLARYGLAVQTRGEDPENSRKMGQKVLEDLVDLQKEPLQKELLRGALDTSRVLNLHAAAIGLQKNVFEWALQAPVLPPQVTLEDRSKADAFAGLLTSRILGMQDIHKQMQDQSQKVSTQLSQVQGQMSTLADKFNPLVPIDHRYLKLSQVLGWVGLGGIGVTVAGMIAQNVASIHPIGVGILAVGGVALGIGMIGQTIVKAKRATVLEAYWPLRNEYDRLDGEQAGLRFSIDAAAKTMSVLDAAIKKDQSQLDVLKMVKNPQPPADGAKIEVGNSEVSIGDVKVHREPGSSDPLPTR